jgi:hypothetical protein
VSLQQRDALEQLLRDAPLDLGGDVAEQRVIFEDMMAAIPSPADVTTSFGSLGGIPVVNVEVAGVDRARVIFYLHGGAYAIGTAASSVGLASDLARRAGARLVTVDYRLAPGKVIRSSRRARRGAGCWLRTTIGASGRTRVSSSRIAWRRRRRPVVLSTRAHAGMDVPVREGSAGPRSGRSRDVRAWAVAFACRCGRRYAPGRRARVSSRTSA